MRISTLAKGPATLVYTRSTPGLVILYPNWARAPFTIFLRPCRDFMPANATAARAPEPAVPGRASYKPLKFMDLVISERS